MSQDVPRVVILGKGKSSRTEEMHDLMSKIELSQIPADLLDSMFVTMSNDQRYKIDKKFLKEGISYSNIDKQIQKLGIGNDVATIEIVVDFDKAKRLLDTEISDLLNPYFDDKSED